MNIFYGPQHSMCVTCVHFEWNETEEIKVAYDINEWIIYGFGSQSIYVLSMCCVVVSFQFVYYISTKWQLLIVVVVGVFFYKFGVDRKKPCVMKRLIAVSMENTHTHTHTTGNRNSLSAIPILITIFNDSIRLANKPNTKNE